MRFVLFYVSGLLTGADCCVINVMSSCGGNRVALLLCTSIANTAVSINADIPAIILASSTSADGCRNKRTWNASLLGQMLSAHVEYLVDEKL